MKALLTSGNIRDAVRKPWTIEWSSGFVKIFWVQSWSFVLVIRTRKCLAKLFWVSSLFFCCRLPRSERKLQMTLCMLAADYWCSQREDYYFTWRMGVILLIMHYSNLCSFLSFLWRSSKYDHAPSQPLPRDTSYNSHRNPTPAAC